MKPEQEKKEKENKGKILRFRVNVQEEKQIRDNATMCGLILSDYLRDSALAKPIQAAVKSDHNPLTLEQRAALVRIGNNLNQAMKLSNAGQWATGDLVDIVKQIQATLA
jgi:alpha-D-ribose 1-methylphosphonate 5-triphosphate diphosphatase PhnM